MNLSRPGQWPATKFNFTKPTSAQQVYKVVHVVSDRMAPLFPADSVVRLQKIESLQNIDPNAFYYVVDRSLNNHFCMLSPGRTSNEYLLRSLNSDKETYPEYYMLADYMLQIFVVTSKPTQS